MPTVGGCRTAKSLATRSQPGAPIKAEPQRRAPGLHLDAEQKVYFVTLRGRT